MTRGGQRKDRDAPERRCIVTGTSGEKASMIRFVVGPDETVVPDLLEKLPGRGMWVSADASALKTAVAKKVFARAARKSVKIPSELPEMVVEGLQKRVVELISMARKAGEALAGYESSGPAFAEKATEIKAWIEQHD